MAASRAVSATLSDLSDQQEMERAGSNESDGSAWDLETQCSVFEDAEEDQNARQKTLNATERWRKNSKMVRRQLKGIKLYYHILSRSGVQLLVGCSTPGLSHGDLGIFLGGGQTEEFVH